MTTPDPRPAAARPPEAAGRPMRAARRLAWLGSLLALAACGGGGGTPPPEPNVTAAGGTVSSADGRARLEVPAGAAAAPARVTLSTVSNPSLPADPDLMPDTVVQLDGDGAALASPAQLTITAGGAFPAGAPAAVLRKKALLWPRVPGQEACDTDGDGDIDGDDYAALVHGAPCYQPPQLVRVDAQTVTLMGICNPPVGLTARCRIDSLAAARLALRFDPVAPTVTVASFDGPQDPSRLTVPRTYTLRVDATDNKGVVRVRFDRLTKVGNNFVVQPLGEDTSAPYEIGVPLTAADNGEVRMIARAFDAWGNTGSAGIVLAVAIDSQAPTATMTAASTTVAVGQAASFDVTAADNGSVVRVELLRNGTVVATDTAPPFAFVTAPFTSADLGAVEFRARAVDISENAGLSAPVAIQVVPPADTQPPTVTLQASAGSVPVGQSITLDATAADDAGVARVEFLRNGVKVAEDTTAPYGYAPPAFGAGDVGTVVWTARAVDTSGNAGTSAAVNVTVTAVAGSEVWVSPTGSDASAGTLAAPLRTLAKAFQTVGANGTVWLHNGVFTAAGEGLAGPDIAIGRALPAGAALKAVNDGGATVGFTLQVPAGGAVVGLNFDTSSQGRVLAGGGTVVISRPSWVKLALTTIGHGIEARGSARVLLDPKGNPLHNYAGTGLTGFLLATDTSEVIVDGGVVDGSTGQANGFALDGSAKLTLKSMTVANTGGAWVGGGGVIYVGGTGNVVLLDGVTIDLANAGAACIVADRQIAGPTPAVDITIAGSTLTRCGGGAMQLREGTPKVTLTASTLSNNGRYAIESGQIGFDSGFVYARPQISATALTATGNAQGGILMNMGGSLTIDGGQLATPASGVQLMGVKPYTLRLRNVAIDAGVNGVRLEGDGTGAFDLGTLASPGGNTLKGATTGLRLTTAAGVTVQAVGNTWTASVQGADANGRYGLASSVCGSQNPCDVSAGTGPNYSFVGAGAGAKLRLAQQ